MPPVELSDLRDWLFSPEAAVPLAPLFDALIAKLTGRGLPVWRAATSVLNRHPELFVRQLVWKRGEPSLVRPRRHGFADQPDYATSPVKVVRERGIAVRRRLTDAAGLDFPQLKDLAAAGGTDYVIYPLSFLNGTRSYLSVATDAPGGFTDAQLKALEGLLQAITTRFELDAAYEATRSLLSVYLGASAAERVLAGKFRRGDGESIRAAIWFCDLRGFTERVDRSPVREVLDVLDRYFDATAGAVMAAGGEVLKFVGDAVLGIFPSEGDPAPSCRAALGAAERALDELERLSKELPHPVRAGVALHVGEVMFGNIGASSRLDFTVIGAAVNEVTRIESLCKPLQTPLLMSGAFVEAVGGESVDLGPQQLKGVSHPLRVATLPRFASR